MSTSNLGEVFSGGATTSQHVDADDDDHFHNTTFKLKRTRSLGLLDEFIDPEQQQKNIKKQSEEKENETLQNVPTSTGAEPEDQSPVVAASPAFLKSPDIVPHDDSDLVVEPSRHVDYLSHQWDVCDISKSWRYVILRRKNVANAARLENASWRTWAQRRSNLKTISPEAVNWSKESDVTWLYGPIVDDDDHDNDNAVGPEDSRSFSTATNVVAGDISIARKTHGPKPILKKRTLEDTMISHLNLLKLEIATARAEQEQTRREDAAAQARRDAIDKAGSERPPEYFDYDVISAKLNSQYKNHSGPNSTNNSSLDLAGKNTSESDVQNSDEVSLSQDNSSTVGKSVLAHPKSHENESPGLPTKEKRHIHFNDEVQQSIIINELDLDNNEGDEYEDDENDYDYEGEDSYLYQSADNSLDDDDDDDDDEDEGGFFLNIRTPSSAHLAGGLPGLPAVGDSKAHEAADISSESSATSSRSIKTIRSLPPTSINYGSDDEDSDDSNPYTSSISHNVDNNSSRGYDYYYDYNSVYQGEPGHAVYNDPPNPPAPRAEPNQILRGDTTVHVGRNAPGQAAREKPRDVLRLDETQPLTTEHRKAPISNPTTIPLDYAEKPSMSTDPKTTGSSILPTGDSQPGTNSILAHSSAYQKDPPRLSKEERRHIHFNNEVQQSIIIHDLDLNNEGDEFDNDEYDYEYEGEDSYLYQSADDYYDDGDDDDDDDDDDDEGGFFLNVRSPSSAHLSGGLPDLSTTSNPDKTEDKTSGSPLAKGASVIKTIRSLPPTTINFGSDDEDSDDSNPYTSSISHNVGSNSSRGYDYYYDYNTVYQGDSNHAIYGSSSENKTPDVLDVPENIGVGSNFDYEIIENEYLKDMNRAAPREQLESVPTSPSNFTARERPNPFSLEASESSSDEDDDEGGLSISARTSSQSLAQLVFGQPLTSSKQESLHYPQNDYEEPEPEARHISSINPNYSSLELSKQPHSSSSLSNQFFSGSMTKPEVDNSLSRSFFDLNSEASGPQTPLTQTSYSGTQSPPVQKKATALPPHTTSANAFLGHKKGALGGGSAFIFDSESESEEESDPEDTDHSVRLGENSRTSYLSLYEVAGRNGISVPNTDGDEANRGKKATMTNFLGGWNKGNASRG